jgi:hypothetical protein
MGLSVENWNWNLCYLEKYPKLGLQFYLSVEPERRYILLKIKLKLRVIWQLTSHFGPVRIGSNLGLRLLGHSELAPTSTPSTGCMLFL